MKRCRQSWKICLSYPIWYPVRQVVNGYRGLKWSIIHFIWENRYDTKVCIYVTGNMGVHVGKIFCWATFVSLKTYSCLKSSNNFPFKRYHVSRASTMKTWSFGTHILSKEISACIFLSLLGDIDLMIFQIVFFSRDKISSSTSLWHAGKKRLCILTNKMMQSCLKLCISFEGCGKSLVFITGYSRFQLRHIWARGVGHIPYQNSWHRLLQILEDKCNWMSPQYCYNAPCGGNCVSALDIHPNLQKSY